VPDHPGHRLSHRVVIDEAVDVAVVGAGPAGCAAAASLARLERTVVLLDSAAPDGARFRIGEGAAPGTSQLIAEIFGDEAQAFMPAAHVPCPSIVSVWGRPEPLALEHMLNPLGHAWNLDRDRFDADLRAGAGRLGAVVRHGARVTTARLDAAGWTIAFTQAPYLRARLVIDASGRGARVARGQGARRRHLDRLVALWAVWSADERDRSSSMYLEAVERGWWYSVLLAGHRRVVVHLTDADLLPAVPRERVGLAESARGLDVIGPALVGRRILAGPEVCSARTGWLDRAGGGAWLAAGDAACTFDPLSGRGIVAALLTGRTAGHAAEALLAGTDGGAEADRHRAAIASMLVDALLERGDVYGAERRWPDAAFWSRRRRLPEEIWEDPALREAARVVAN
jgi:flavin-dependent dehydrogenase